MNQIKVMLAYLLDWVLTGGRLSFDAVQESPLPSNTLALAPVAPQPPVSEPVAERRVDPLDPDNAPKMRRPKARPYISKKAPEDETLCPPWVKLDLGGLWAVPAGAPFVDAVQLREVELLRGSKSVRAAEVYSAWGSDTGPRVSYEGMPLYVEARGPVGTEGLPWSTGRLRLETHPDLSPVRARGYYGAPGVYHELQCVAPAANRLLEIIGTITPVPWRLEDAARPVSDDPLTQERYEEQVAYQKRLWASWTAPGKKRTLRHLIEEMVRMPLVYGCGLWECYIDHDGSEALPAFRSPMSVEKWVLQGETPIGWVQQTNTADSSGRSSHRVLIPWERTIHIAHDPTGPTDLEGRSLMRSAYTPLVAIRDLLQVQGLSIATNAMGTWTTEVDKDAQITDSQLNAIADHLLAYESAHIPFIIPPKGVKMVHHAPDTSVVDLSPHISEYERQAALSMGGGHSYIALGGTGSQAAKEVASGDARDLSDKYPSLAAGGIEQALRIYLQIAFPGKEHYVCTVAWGQVEVRDNGAYLDNIAKYLAIKDKLAVEQQEHLEDMLDLPSAAKARGPASVNLADDSEATIRVPKSVQEEALIGLRWLEQGLGGEGLTQVGKVRAQQLAAGRPISRNVVERMHRFFQRFRHYKAKTGWNRGEPGFPIPARVTWQLWGGDEGERFVAARVEEFDKEDASLDGT